MTDKIVQASLFQKRIWFMEQLVHSAAYHVVACYEVQAEIDIQKLEESMTIVATRHELLRSSFTCNDGEVLINISPDVKMDFELIDLSAEAIKFQKMLAQRYAEEILKQKFELNVYPLWRVRIYKLSNQTHILAFVAHHIIFDGLSLDIFFSELGEIYENKIKNSECHTLNNLIVQYSDYVDWQRNFLNSDEYDKQLSFWKNNLDNTNSFLNMPTDRVRLVEASYSGSNQYIIFPENFHEKIKNYALNNHGTHYMVLLTTFAILLSLHANRDQVLIGIPFQSRKNAKQRQLIGFFVNTLVCRVNLYNFKITFNELFKEVKKTTLNIYSNADIPFDLLIEELKIERNSLYSPLIQVMFNYLRTAERKLGPDGPILYPINLENAASMFDISLNIQEMKGLLQGVIEYNTDIYIADTMIGFISNYISLLDQVLSYPDATLNEIKLISEFIN
jgi:hypothetical protein